MTEFAEIRSGASSGDPDDFTTVKPRLAGVFLPVKSFHGDFGKLKAEVVVYASLVEVARRFLSSFRLPISGVDVAIECGPADGWWRTLARSKKNRPASNSSRR